MSDAAAKALGETAGESGGFITGFVGLVEYIDDDGDHCWSLLIADNQRVSVSHGLSTTLGKLMDAQLDDALFGDD